MADAEAKAKAEKITAAKKRVEALKKKKAGKAAEKKEETAEKPTVPEDKRVVEDQPKVDDVAVPVPAAEESKPAEEPVEESASQASTTTHGRKPSVSVQSKMRSSSFRQSISSPVISPGSLKMPIFNPDEDNAHEIFRKQSARIEELEKENKRVLKEIGDIEKKWKKAEEELEDLREADAPEKAPALVPTTPASSDEGIERLKAEIAALQRQNSQLQAQVSRGGHRSPSVSLNAASDDDLQTLLASKSSTIESMELEISNLRAQLARTSTGSTASQEQIAALNDKLSRTKSALDLSQRELSDLKKNLEHTTAKAVKEGSERTSAETKLRTLTKEAEDAKAESEELKKRVEGLEKKVAALTTLHKEHDARSQALKKEREKAEKEAADLRHRLAIVENENLRVREERDRLKKRDAQGIDDDGVDELENEERQRLEAKVRALEAEVHELRSGVWKERRGMLDGDNGVGSPAAKFTDVDLSSSPVRRRSIAQGGPTKGLGDFFSAFASAVTGDGDDELLEDEDEKGFDEEAFRMAQEEEARKRIERVREVKRKLADWRGWRLDLVEARRGGGEALGEIFEV